MIPIVILASGRGSNFEAIQTAVREKRLQTKILAVISDQAEAGVLSKAREAGIPSIAIPFAGPMKRVEHENLMMEELKKLRPTFLVLAGYMRILTASFIESFRSEKGYSRIVNIHPSLLPAFPGVNSYAQAFQYGTKVAGATVHFVENDVDSGPICAQETFSIEDCNSVSEVEKRGLAVEHRLYPKTLEWILTEKFSLERRAKERFYVRPN